MKKFIRESMIFLLIFIAFPIAYNFSIKTSGQIDQIFRFILSFGLQYKILEKIAF